MAESGGRTLWKVVATFRDGTTKEYRVATMNEVTLIRAELLVGSNRPSVSVTRESRDD